MTVKLLIFVQNAPVLIMKRAFDAPAYGSRRGMMNKALIPYMTASPCPYAHTGQFAAPSALL